MTDQSPIRARWSDGAFVPVGNYAMAQCHDDLTEGQIVALTVEHERSGNSHRHQFATIREAWLNLPEHLAQMPFAASAESLRKHALIATGFYDVVSTDCGSGAAAERVAAMAKPLAVAAHGYAIVKLSGPIVLVYTPRSQSMRAMPGGEFQRSKSACLEWIARQISVTPGDLAGAAV